MWTLPSQQLLRAIRGERSQEAFARRVGVSASTVAAWENGRRFPTLEVALAASRALGDTPVTRLEGFHPVRFEPSDVPHWLGLLQGDQTHTEVAADSGFSRHQIGRWLGGRATPRLPEFLALLHALTGRAEDFVALWVDISAVPALEPAWRLRQRARSLAWEEPWSEAVLQIVRSRAYRQHPEPSAQVLAGWLRAPVADITRTLSRLRDAGLLRPHNGRDLPGDAITVDTGHNAVAVRTLKRHWAHVAAERAGEPNGLCAYNVFACAPEDLTVLREELLGAFRRARARIAASDNTDASALLLVQLLPFGESANTEQA